MSSLRDAMLDAVFWVIVFLFFFMKNEKCHLNDVNLPSRGGGEPME
jgi:hypothetical protein